MPMQRRQVPVLPERPAAESVVRKAHRSYPVGRHLYSRAFAGNVLELTISAANHFPPDVQARVVTTLNSKRGEDPIRYPFVRSDDRHFTCRIAPERTGFYSFRTQFSSDGGSNWFPDPVADAWVLVDPPQADGLRLYTMIPSVSGSIADWAGDLPRIKDMGFNAVHLLPLTTLDASLSPYAARELFDIDHSYLIAGLRTDGLSQLEDFVEAARSLDIRLCFDLVLNHIGAASSIARRLRLDRARSQQLRWSQARRILVGKRLAPLGRPGAHQLRAPLGPDQGRNLGVHDRICSVLGEVRELHQRLHSFRQPPQQRHFIPAHAHEDAAR